MNALIIILTATVILTVFVALAHSVGKKRSFVENQIPVLLGDYWLRGRDFRMALERKGLRTTKVGLMATLEMLAEEGLVEIDMRSETISVQAYSDELCQSKGAKSISIDLRHGSTVEVEVMWLRLPDKPDC